MRVITNLDSDKRPVNESCKLLEQQLLLIFPGQEITLSVLKDCLILRGKSTTGRKEILSQIVLNYIASNN